MLGIIPLVCGGLPRWLRLQAAGPPAMQETWLQSLGWEDPWRRKGQPTPALLSGKSHGQRSLVGYRPQGHKRIAYNLATKPQHLYVVPKTGKSIQAGSRIVVTFPREKLEVGQGEDKELVLNGDRVSVWDG